MAAFGQLASTVLMGAFAAIVAVVVVYGRDWRTYSAPGSGERSIGETLRAASRSPTAWIVGFLALAAVLGGGALAFVGGLGVDPGSVSVAVPALFGLVILGYLLWGVWYTARSRGLGNAQAALVGVWAFGLLFVLAIAAKLLTG